MEPNPKIIKTVEDIMGRHVPSIEVFSTDNPVTTSQIATKLGQDAAIVVICWLLPEDFDAIVAILSPRWKTYAEWQDQANTKLASLREKLPTAKILRVVVRPHAFKNWCESQEFAPDEYAQAVYALALYKSNHPIDIFCPQGEVQWTK